MPLEPPNQLSLSRELYLPPFFIALPPPQQPAAHRNCLTRAAAAARTLGAAWQKEHTCQSNVKELL